MHLIKNFRNYSFDIKQPLMHLKVPVKSAKKFFLRKVFSIEMIKARKDLILFRDPHFVLVLTDITNSFDLC